MKLSDLEALVKAPRERADYYGHKDPNVELCHRVMGSDFAWVKEGRP